MFIVASNDLGGAGAGITAWLFGPVLSVVGGGVGAILVVLAVMRLWPRSSPGIGLLSHSDFRPESLGRGRRGDAYGVEGETRRGGRGGEGERGETGRGGERGRRGEGERGRRGEGERGEGETAGRCFSRMEQAAEFRHSECRGRIYTARGRKCSNPKRERGPQGIPSLTLRVTIERLICTHANYSLRRSPAKILSLRLDLPAGCRFIRLNFYPQQNLPLSPSPHLPLSLCPSPPLFYRGRFGVQARTIRKEGL